MTKCDDNMDELRREVKELRENKIRDEGFKAGVSWSIARAVVVCSAFWGVMGLIINYGGVYAYNHIPRIRQIVDIINGVR